MLEGQNFASGSGHLMVFNKYTIRSFFSVHVVMVTHLLDLLTPFQVQSVLKLAGNAFYFQFFINMYDFIFFPQRFSFLQYT